MRHRFILLLLVGTSAAPVIAQDVVVMRRSVGVSRVAPGQGSPTPTPAPTPNPTPTPTPTPTPVTPAEWTTTAWMAGADACGSRTDTRGVSCQRAGTTVPESMCTGEHPETTRQTPDITACARAWATGEWDTPAVQCGQTVTRTRSVECHITLADGSHAVVDDAQCSGTRPAASEPFEDASSCTYSWKTGQWGPYSSTCSSNSTRTRDVWCERNDGTHVIDNGTYCPTSTRPDTQESAQILSNCTSLTPWGTFEASNGEEHGFATTEGPSVAHGGKQLAYLPRNGTASFTLPVAFNGKYRISMWIRSDSGTSFVTLNALNTGSTTVATGSLSATTSYQEMVVTFTAGPPYFASGSKTFGVQLKNANQKDVYVDDVTVIQIP